MHTNASHPKKQKETELHGDLQEFRGPAVSPNDPSIEPRVRRGRPLQEKPGPAAGNDTGAEPSKQSE
jgi:hypothetical protein